MSAPSKPNSIILAIKGLYLNPSTFGGNAPEGALTIADDVVIDRPSVVATRRGFSNAFSTISTNANSLFQFANVKLLHGSDNKMYRDLADNGVWTAYTGTYLVPAPTDTSSRVRGLESNKNFYFITENGTYRIDTPGGEPRLAGAPAGLSGTGVPVGATGFFPDQTNIAYRVVFGYKDANQQLVLGAPSSRIVIQNTSGTDANVQLTFQQPKEVQANPTNFFFQVYRSSPSPNLLTEPDDEMALTYEETCNNSATRTIDDLTPATLLGAALYTNQGQDGILQSNYRPPWAMDITTFKQYAFYANTRTTQSAAITLISAGASNGNNPLVPGDTITFTPATGSPFTLTAIAGVNNPTLGQFQVSNTGNPGFDIQVTASNIALVSNGYPTNTFLAGYYTSTGNDLPGKLNFERLSLVNETFTITVSNHLSWEQPFPVTSRNDARPNRVYYSKFNQPEAVPLVNYIELGSANASIKRIVPLRDGVMVLKDDGVFRISNAAPPFTITPIDYNIRILAPNTAAELANRVYFLSDQGVVALSDSDSEIQSFVLDKTIIENTSPTLFPTLQQTAWGIAYQSDRKYILSMPTNSTDIQAQQQYVYNHITDVWTRWTRATTCGLVFRKDNKLYLGSRESAPVSGSYVYQERKSFTQQDYVDNQYTTLCQTNTATDTIIVNNIAYPDGIEALPGWTIIQGSSGSNARIVSVQVGVSTTTIVVNRVQQWLNNDLTLYTPVKSLVRTIQLDCQNPGMNKQFSEIVYMFTEQSFSRLTASITSNTAGIPAVDYLIPQNPGGWGIDPWGTTPWGGAPSSQGKIRRYTPQPIQRAGWMNISITNEEAFTSFGWSGVELFYKNTSSRQK